MSRFYVQDPHIDGLAVIDCEQHSMVISSFGDREDRARTMLQALADCLNAATDPDYEGARTDAYKACPDVLKWRAIEHLAALLDQHAKLSV